MGYILGYATDISVQDVVNQTNDQRASAGLPPLTLNMALSNAAAGKAQDMFNKQYWAHTSPDGVEPWAFISGAGYSYIAAGENLARDFLHTGDMISAWMASPTHKANIINPKYQEIGIAVVNGTLDGIETTLVVQMFGAAQTANAQNMAAVTQQAAATQDNQLTRENNEQSENTTAEPAAEKSLSDKLEQPIFEVEQALALSSGEPDFTSQSSYISPLHLIKSFAAAVLILLMGTLIYDMVIIKQHPRTRFTGKNAAHLMYFLAITFVILVFRSGFIG